MPSASAISLMRRIALGAATILYKLSNFPRKSSAPSKQHGTMPAHPLQENAVVSFRFNFGAPADRYFLDKGD
jgi:hypothetical protein